MYLYRSDISKFLFDYRYFQLIFTDTLHKEHLSRDEKISIYEAALKNFKDRGQLESYRLLDFEPPPSPHSQHPTSSDDEQAGVHN